MGRWHHRHQLIQSFYVIDNVVGGVGVNQYVPNRQVPVCIPRAKGCEEVYISPRVDPSPAKPGRGSE